MKLFEKIGTWWNDYRRKRFIRRELLAKFKHYNNDNKQRLDLLTEALFKSSKAVSADVAYAELKRQEANDNAFLMELKTFVEKHYGNKSKEINELNKQIDEFGKENKKLKVNLKVEKQRNKLMSVS